MNDADLLLTEADLPESCEKRGEPGITGPLSAGEWEALRHQATRDTLPLIVKLGAFHGAWTMPRNRDECPLCSGRRDEPGQRELIETQ